MSELVSIAHSLMYNTTSEVIEKYEARLWELQRDVKRLETIKQKAYEACSTRDNATMLECITLCDSYDLPF